MGYEDRRWDEGKSYTFVHLRWELGTGLVKAKCAAFLAMYLRRPFCEHFGFDPPGAFAAGAKTYIKVHHAHPVGHADGEQETELVD
jgi:predicted HNH restriction endonuclease